MARSAGISKRSTKPKGSDRASKAIITSTPGKGRRKLVLQLGLLSICVAAVGLAVYTTIPQQNRSITGRLDSTANAGQTQAVSYGQSPQTFNELLALTPEQLAKVDIARMNLLCATGLPGSDDLTSDTIESMLGRIDKWAERVRFETERHRHWLTDPRHADKAKHFGHSEARFRAELLVDVLQNDLGVKYHDSFVPADQAVPPFKTSKETFLHGLLDHEDPKQAFGGNCVSLPVIYVAVGRRLGYPIKLVTSNEHVFCRWMGEGHSNAAWKDTFNFDGAGAGFSIDPDEFYLTWPNKSTQAQAEIFDWFKPLTPSQELPLFLLARGHIQRQVDQNLHTAQISYTLAAHLWPSNRNPLLLLSSNGNQIWEREYAQHPGTRPPSQAAAGVTPAAEVAEASITDDRPWWETREGRARNDQFVRQMNEVNRLNQIARENQLRMMQAYQSPTVLGHPQAAYSGHPPSTHHPTSGFPQPYPTPQPHYGTPGEPWPAPR
ncbi:MAG: hypothetical protein AAGG38_12015 [Planctomycetota bacterium]